MFCYQCQETAKGAGCINKGVCGKTEEVAVLQDILLYSLKGFSIYANEAKKTGVVTPEMDKYVIDSLFTTITNTNFDAREFESRIKTVLKYRDELSSKLDVQKVKIPNSDHDAAVWTPGPHEDLSQKAEIASILSTENEDIRSLRELLVYGIKGMSAYLHHADNLVYKDDGFIVFIYKVLASTLDDSLGADDYFGLVMECGKFGVDAMALLDKANTETFGNPEISKVNIGVRKNPGILISGHDLSDMVELLKQTEDTGVDVYTHSEMLPAHYYPELKKYSHLVGNYGNAWWEQKNEFERFNGPVLMTTNCLVPPKDSYKDRVYTTGAVGFENIKHIPEGENGNGKDFSGIIEHAKKCSPPDELEQGEIVGGFGHNQVLALADKVVDAVKSGAIKRFFVMAGCDGRMKSRSYYTEFAENLSEDTVILTAGCAKYRYNKLDLGDIGGIPRVLDAGQCNDSYSLAVVALKLKEVFGLDDINDLPITYNISWYEQKAVIVLLALLYLGVKNIHLGPTLPAFLSPNIANVLVDKFGIGVITSPEEDIEMFMKTG